MSDVPLAPPPQVRLELVRDETAQSSCRAGFMRVNRYDIRWHADDGTASQPYRYDVVDRAAIDAVAILLEADLGEEPAICLRAAIRPPLAFRHRLSAPFEQPTTSVLWELPAGIIEARERGATGLCACAARETLEEVGIAVRAEQFVQLGPPVYLSPGVLAEKIYFMHATVGIPDTLTPAGDGSPNEGWSVLRFVPLRVALAAAGRGVIQDAKTELALQRLGRLRGVG